VSDDNIFSRKSKFSQVNFSFILIEIQKLIFRVFSGTKQRDKACMQPKKPKPRVILNTSEKKKKNLKPYLDGDGGGDVGGIVVDDNVVGQNDDVVLDFLGHALVLRGRHVEPNSLPLLYDVASDEAENQQRNHHLPAHLSTP
jgi:hypothetical protein